MSRLDEIEKRWRELYKTDLPNEDLPYLIDRCRNLEKVAAAAKVFDELFHDDMEKHWWCADMEEAKTLRNALKALDEPKEQFSGVEME